MLFSAFQHIQTPNSFEHHLINKSLLLFPFQQANWGIKNEKCARELYYKEIGTSYENLVVSEVTVVINSVIGHSFLLN